MSTEMGDQQDAGLEFEPRAVVRSLVERLRAYPWLPLTLLCFYGALALGIAAVVQPSYTATATVAPPASSLSASATSSLSSGLSGLASKLGGGLLGGQQTDPFSEFTDILTSNHLAAVLAQDKSFIGRIFYKQYDAKTGTWYPVGGPLRDVINAIKSIFHYPIKSHPDQDDLAKYFGQSMTVNTSLTSSFVTVTLDLNDPTDAEKALGKVLTTADNIVRGEMRRDVDARLAYLSGVLPKVAQSDQRDALIALQSAQEQQRMILAADKRYSFALVDPPHADLTPTFPSIPKFIGGAIMLAMMTWAAMVYMMSPANWLLRMFARRPRQPGIPGRVGLLERFARLWSRPEGWQKNS